MKPDAVNTKEMGAPRGIPKDVWAKTYAVVGHPKAEDHYHRRWITAQLILTARNQGRDEGLEEAAARCDEFAKTGSRLWQEDKTDRADLILAQSYAAQSCAEAIAALRKSQGGR